ncbi:alkaline phosphatase [Neisseria weixii]|uniref:Alkaline phosphatase n=1 Tax=Neisseria weixii TaxID=1853276 RepID=A0A3N4N771_9NEIS|nr:C40 family peptidase [Neisseria weixii]RPD86265.1 alkaline phosphatase [Neisseria weixii]RPD89416.1 alkaline phosphatase [Neisseria weixii]
MKLTKKITAEILNAAEKAKPREMCGFIVQGGRKPVFIQAENLAENPDEFFEISPESFIAAEEAGEILAVVHSHPNDEPYLSGADRQIHAGQSYPWVLVTQGRLKTFRACRHLRGRVFDYGNADCYTVIRDAYGLMGIDLADYPRRDIETDAAADMFVNNMADIGFKRLPDGLKNLQAGDVVLTALGGNANHAALYLGNGEILHHAYNQLSRREPFGNFWQSAAHSVWRHTDFEPAMMEAVFNDLEHAEGL